MELTATTVPLLGLAAGLCGACMSTLLAIMALCAAGKLDSAKLTWNSPNELRKIHCTGLVLGVPATFIVTLCLLNIWCALLAAITAGAFSMWALLFMDAELRKNFRAVCLDQLKQLRMGTTGSLRNWRSALAARVKRFSVRTQPAAGELTQEAILRIQQQIDRLKEWAALSSEQKNERRRLVDAVEEATGRLTGAVADLRKKESDRSGIAFHVDGLAKYAIPVEVMAGLQSALAAVADLVSQQKLAVSDELGTIQAAREALTAHQEQCATGQISPDNALAMVTTALNLAEKALANAQAAK